MLYLLANDYAWVAAALAIGLAVGWLTTTFDQRAKFSGGWIVVAAILLLGAGFVVSSSGAISGRDGLMFDAGLLLVTAYVVGLPIGGGARHLAPAPAPHPPAKRPSIVVVRGESQNSQSASATTAEPAVAAPAVPEPVAAAPAPEPAAVEPATAEPAAPAPAAPEPVAVEPATPEPATAAPAALEPLATAPTAPEPAAAEPATPEPVAATPANDQIRLEKAPPASAKQRERADNPPAGSKPEGLSAPRGGAPDDLSKIKGVGPKSQEKLNALGIFHYDQIAAWTPEETRWVGAALGVPGRVERGRWVAQAKALAGREGPTQMQ
jgi:predicted flap endonuclease-1-like 5' DNA nuclease